MSKAKKRELPPIGAARRAIEFAVLSMLFFPMLVGVFDLSIQIYADLLLHRAAQSAARDAQIGQFSGEDDASEAAMRQSLCTNTRGFFDCQEFKLQVQVFEDFASAVVDMEDPYGETDGQNDEVVEAFDLGGPDEIVVFRIIYDWPVLLDHPLLPDFGGADGVRRFVATVVARNEPAPEG